jgi:RNA polymerase sigma factor (sigma-70 family)
METMLERDDLLIAEFNTRRSEEAFAMLVRQHVHLVFATALRQVGDAGAAGEITQNVFVALAQAAGKLGSHPTVAGWLHRTALNKSREWLRSELRRRRREHVAVNLELAGAEGDSVWLPLVPLLDEALLELREPDRLAVMMHFMEGQTFQDVGPVLGIGEDAARKRVARCLGQLTHFFRRRGFAVPVLAPCAPLFALSSHAVPAGLAASATTAGAAAAHSAASTSTLTLIKGALKIMAWTKAKMAIVVGAGVLLAAGTTIVTVREIAAHKARLAQPAPTLGQEWLRSYAVNKNVADFSEAEDLSTPESAYAAFVRARARNDGSALERLSVATFRDLYRADPVARKSLTHFFNSPKGQAVIAQTRRAEIVEVWIYHDSAAEVIVRLPVPKPETDQFLAEAFQLEDGRWLFANDNVCNTLSQARDTATAKLAREGK